MFHLNAREKDICGKKRLKNIILQKKKNQSACWQKDIKQKLMNKKAALMTAWMKNDDEF